MSEEDKPPGSTCREFELLMMRALDGEISPAEKARLEEHLKSCCGCGRAFAEYGRIAAATNEVALRPVPQEQWELYWTNVHNRLERSFAQAVFYFGAAFVAAFAVMRFAGWVVTTSSLSWWVKGAILALAAGFAWLFVSVAREKLTLRKTDKYTEVKR